MNTQLHEQPCRCTKPVLPIPSSHAEDEIIERAINILASRYKRSHYLTSPEHARDYVMLAHARESREVFAVLLLDNQHGVMGYEKLFLGTIDEAAVHPREVVRLAIERQASAVILVHNHPSGHPVPSATDKAVTDKIVRALSTVDIRVLDHLLVAGTKIVSFAEEGLMPI